MTRDVPGMKRNTRFIGPLTLAAIWMKILL